MPLILHATLVYTSSALPIFVVFSLTLVYTRDLHAHSCNAREMHAYAKHPRCKFELLAGLCFARIRRIAKDPHIPLRGEGFPLEPVAIWPLRAAR